jgi:hypothetical protein
VLSQRIQTLMTRFTCLGCIYCFAENLHTLIYALVLLRSIHCQTSIRNRIKQRSDLTQLTLWILRPELFACKYWLFFSERLTAMISLTPVFPRYLLLLHTKNVIWNLHNSHKDNDTYKIIRKDSKLIFLLFFLSQLFMIYKIIGKASKLWSDLFICCMCACVFGLSTNLWISWLGDKSLK